MKLSGPIELIKKSFQIFFEKKNLIFFLKTYAILIPFSLFLLFQNSIVKIDTQNLALSEVNVLITKYGWLFGLAVLVNLAYLVVSFWVNAAGIKAISEVTNGTEIGVKEVLSFAWKKLWMFSLLSIAVGFVVGFGFILLIIPGIIFMVWFHFSSYEFMTKRTGIRESMRNSKKLSAGRFWKVLGRFLVFGLFQILVQITVGLIPMSLGNVIFPLAGPLLILPYFLLYKELDVVQGASGQ